MYNSILNFYCPWKSQRFVKLKKLKKLKVVFHLPDWSPRNGQENFCQVTSGFLFFFLS